jgi:hypothetical protein
MPVWKLQSSFLAHTAFPRDRIVMTPHFNDQGPGGDTQSLVDDLADRYEEIFSVFTGEIKVTAYDAEGTPPVYPVAEAIRRAGVVGSPNAPRELAVCLSFYHERNLPRNRGRLYIPAGFLNIGTQTTKPPMPIAIMPLLATAFTDLGGLNVDWSVYSKVDGEPKKVTHWWYDNEWDVMRSRGLKADSRLLQTTSE